MIKKSGQMITAAIFVIVLVTLLINRSGNQMNLADAKTRDSERVRAPEFRSVDAWLNTDRALTLKDLRGQVVLLDFWTYCCINCMHVFSDLKYLEQKFSHKPFVVVGVHSGKFSQEKDPQNIRQAILRHNIEHPVAVDSDYQIWNSYGIRAWPSLVLIDPEGYIAGKVAGEGHRNLLDKTIARLLDEHRKKGTLAEPMKFKLERGTSKPGILNYPGKVLTDPAGKRLFISDTNHHRVLIADLTGKVQHIIGSGAIGLKDGTFRRAQFHQPQGLTLSADGQFLHVADTENHALRAVDLANQKVSTIAGTSKQSYDYNADGPGESTPLSSPWDLARVDHQIFIAMAGTHQIWIYNLKSKRISVFAGTGREDRIDGPNRTAAFAQPSGLTSDGKLLYVADAEISTIRIVELRPNGKTKTLAGGGKLFDFGKRDGLGASARFQHPLGVALKNNQLFVADTFNNIIRTVDLKTREVTTWPGTGPTKTDTKSNVGLYEPGGLSIAGQKLYIADTNNHRILVADLESGRALTLNVELP